MGRKEVVQIRRPLQSLSKPSPLRVRVAIEVLEWAVSAVDYQDPARVHHSVTGLMKEEIQRLKAWRPPERCEICGGRLIKDIVHKHTVECDSCDGVGWVEDGEAIKTKCAKCGGKGAIRGE